MSTNKKEQEDNVLIITVTSLGDRIPFLLELRDSVLSQTHDDFHWFIYVHNVSLDIFTYFSNKYSVPNKISFVYNNDKQKIHEARNNIVKIASKEKSFNYILNVDDDDLLSEDTLKHHLDAFKKNDVSFTLGRLVDMNAHGLAYHEYHLPLPPGIVTIKEVRDGWPFSQAPIPAASHMAMFKLSVFNDIGGYPSCSGDDIAIIINLVLSGYVAFNHEKIVYYYRDWDGQVMKTEEYLKQDEKMRRTLHNLLHK